jgi:tRNA (guanine-N7-)-methyltransferase
MPAESSQTFCAEWKPESILERADWSRIFGRVAPVEIDYGCGEGAFLIAQAQKNPERNFLATERLVGRVEKVWRAAERLGLNHVRVLRMENAYTAQFLVPPESVATVYVSFPDPWPKRAHQARRLVQPEFIDSVREGMQRGGELRLKTDDLPYFQWMEKVMASAKGWQREEWVEDEGYPITNFEARFIAQGLPIHRSLYRKI